MFERLANGIPLHEAAAYFIKLKDFEKVADANAAGGASYAPPDETGELEGQFTVPVEQVLAHMAKMVQNELKTNYAYMVYANSLRDLSHHAVAEEFEDHAHDETDHADWLLRRMAVLGGPVTVPDIPAPPAATEAHDILQTMVRMEQEGIENWRILRQMVGDENATKFKIEEYLTKEQEHLDELWQMLPAEANPTVMAQRAGSVPSTSLPPMPGMSEPDTNTQPKEPPAQGVKTAAAQIERCHPDTLHMHGAAMKLALMGGNTRGTTIIPGVGLDGEMKTASANLRASAELMKRKTALAAAWARAKTAEGMPGAPPLPDTAMGKQQAAPSPPPLSGAAAGQVMKMAGKGDAEQAEVGRSRAIANLASGFTSDAHTRGERAGDLAGRIAGAVGGGLAGKHLAGGRHPGLDLAGTLGGAALGQHLGGRAGKSVGQEVDAHSFHKKYAAQMKQALSEMTVPTGSAQTPGVSDGYGTPPQEPPGGAGGAAAGPPPAPQLDPETAAYLQKEQEGMAAEQSAQQDFYKQKFEAATQQLQQTQEQAQAAQQQLDQFNQQQAQMQQQQQAIEQAAMQNAQAAHTAATQAMQQSLSAQKETINQQQLAVGMRDAVHAMRQSLMQQIQQELPPATTAESNAMAIDQTNAQQQAAAGQSQEQPADMNAQAASGGQDNSQQPGAAGQQQPSNTSGQPNAAPDAGTPPGSPSPGGAGPEDGSNGEGKKPMMEGATPQGQKGQSADQPPISVKVGSPHDQFVGAIMGGAGGALAGGLGGLAESRMSNDPLRKKVKMLEQREGEGGGFINALNLAQAKARLALGEFSESHPGAATAISAGLGAAQGAAFGHHLATPKTL